MALVPYKNNSSTLTFERAYESVNGVTALIAGRSIATPYKLEVARKFTPPGAPGNDLISVKVTRTEQNATTGKLASLVATLSISIPKDQTVLTATAQKEAMAVLASLCNESTAMEATTTFMTTIIEGRNPI